jgi:hypothetical protein
MGLLLLIFISVVIFDSSLAFHSSLLLRRTPVVAPLQDTATLVEQSYNLAAGSAVIGTAFGVAENFKGNLGKLFGAGAIVFTLFGGFVAYQTATLAFKFDDDSFSLVKADGSSIGENVVVGGENRWRLNSIVNYDFYPSSKFPILVYFKETQTATTARVDAPAIIDDGLEGQAHYFPAIARSDRLIELFEKNNCKHL